jgi:hypothetical protein
MFRASQWFYSDRARFGWVSGGLCVFAPKPVLNRVLPLARFPVPVA